MPTRYEVGMACLRLSDFSVEMSGYCDDQAYSKTLSVLTCHEPHQIIIPPAMHEQVLPCQVPHSRQRSH